MIGIGIMPVGIDGFEEVMSRVEEFKDENLERLKLAKFIIGFSKEVEASRSDAFGKSACQIVRSLAKAEAMNIIESIKEDLENEM